MTIEMTVVCDRCSRVICAARNVSTARKENRRMGGVGPISLARDYCAECVNRIAHDPNAPDALRGPCRASRRGRSA